MIEYTTKINGLRNYALTLKTNNLDLFMSVESEIYKAKCKENKIDCTPDMKNKEKIISTANDSNNEKKTISITIEIP